MDEIQVYKILSGIEKLTANIYSELLKEYGESLVNLVIEKMIDEDSENSNKFDYYINRILSYDDSIVSKSLYDAYMIDINSIPVLTSEEKVIMTREIHNIVNEIVELLSIANYEQVNSSWISDKVEVCIKTCTDKELLDKIKKLYNKFLYKRNLLTEANLKLVISFGKKFYKAGSDFNDLIQYGNVGLMRAIEKYDPNRNACLSTYAYHWIKQSITRNMPNLSYPVDIPYNLISLNISINKAIKILTNEFGYEPTDKEVAKYLNVSEEKVREVKFLFLDSFSLNEMISSLDNSSGDGTFIEFIEDRNSNVEEKIFYDNMCNELMEILKNTLTDQEYDVICHRFGLDDCSRKTLEEIGQKYGLSRERIRQIEKKVLKRKLKVKCRELRVYI